MRIVSLNAWGGTMFDALAEWLPLCGADVLCLQEVTRTPGLGGSTSFDDGERSLPQRANLFDDICAALPRHQCMFVASDAGPVRDPDGRLHQQDFGLATFVGEGFPIVGHQTAFVHRSFLDHTEWPTTDRPRAAQAVRLIDRAADRAVSVVHLHGLRDRSGKSDNSARRAQAEAVARLVTEVRAPTDITVVCGDLNLLPDSETFAILGAIGLVDLVGQMDTRTSRYQKPLRHANYLLVSHPDDVKAFDIPAEPEVSDHRPLVLDI